MPKQVFFALGVVSLGLAYLGVAMPGIPGIPFILLASYFFLRSSDRMYQWMLRQPVFGKVLQRFGEEGPLPLGFRWFVLSQLWVSFLVAGIWLVKGLIGRILLGLLCAACSWFWWRFRR